VKILEANEIVAGYGKSEILHGVSLYVEKEEAITIIGPNGAGKSTLLKALMGYIPIFKGDVYWKGDNITHLKPHEKVNQSKEIIKERMEKAFLLFPILADRVKQKAGTLSGGERQMLGMARALMSDPELLMLDEPSAGLSPKVSEEVFLTIADIHEKMGRAIVIIEQDARPIWEGKKL